MPILTFLPKYYNIFYGDLMKYFIEKSSLPSTRAKEIIKEQLGAEVLYEKNGKPYTEKAPVSISHSGEFVLVGINKKEIGVDIEIIKPFDSRLIKRYFSKNEEDYLKCYKDFFKVWTVKEAYLKLTGEGLKGLSKLNVVKDNKLYIEGCNILSFEENGCQVAIVYK